jgi:hypothetical protein
MPGFGTTAPEATTRNTIGDIYPNQEQVLYGSRVADILSFLPDDLKSKYTGQVGKQNLNARYGNKDVIQNINTLQTKEPRTPGNPEDPHVPDAYWKSQDPGRKFEKIQSDILDAQIQRQTQQLTTGRAFTSSELQEINTGLRLDKVNESIVGLPTLDADHAAQFVLAASNNSFYMIQLSKAIDALVATYGNRLQFGTVYRNSKDGSVSLIPNYTTDTVQNRLQASAIILFQLISIGALKPEDELQIRPINIKTGEFEVSQADINYNKEARRLKLPLKGQFKINSRITNVGQKYATFTGVDVKVSYAIGYAVGNLEGMTLISWSIHRGKPDAPRGDEVAPIYRARGKRTIAGSMVFAMFDEHPITAIYPPNFFPQDPDFQIDSAVRNDIIKPDQLPPFDLFVILTNEYGFCSILILYGVEIMDDGGSINTNDMVNEEVIQYTAKDIDLLHSVKVGEDGLIDPFALASIQDGKIFERRTQIAGYDSEPAFYAQYDKYSET